MFSRVQDIIKNKPYLAWYINQSTELSDEVVLEQVLNYGDWDDVSNFISIQGMTKTAELFTKTNEKDRSNYRPEIANYFTLYFKKHAQ